jgi:hypothetical protein
MANTKIQIKRSTVTATPTTLDIGELAYSYASNTLYIGNTTGTGVLAIGGTGLTSGGASTEYVQQVGAAANAYANLVGTSVNAYANLVGTSSNAYASSVGVAANLYASAVGTSANAYASSVGVSANVYADSVGVSSNNWATSTFVKLSSATTQTVTSDIAIAGNLTISGTQTYANSQTLLIGDNLITLNADIPNNVAPVENSGIEINRGNKNSNAALTFIESVGRWAFSSNTLNAYTTYIASNTDIESIGTSSNAYASSVGIAANAYAAVVGAAANTNAANGSYISTGVVKVPFGGTGLTTFTQNGILFGNTVGDLKVTAAGTEGQVLQASATGVPSFGMLDGGSF